MIISPHNMQWLVTGMLLLCLTGCDLFGSDDNSLSLQPDQETYAVSVNQDQVQGTLSYTLRNESLQSAAFPKCGDGALPPPRLQFKNDGMWTDAYRQGYILIKCPDQEVMPRSTYQGSFDLQVGGDDWVRNTIEGSYRLAWRIRVNDDFKSVYSNPFTLTVE